MMVPAPCKLTTCPLSDDISITQALSTLQFGSVCGLEYWEFKEIRSQIPKEYSFLLETDIFWKACRRVHWSLCLEFQNFNKQYSFVFIPLVVFLYHILDSYQWWKHTMAVLTLHMSMELARLFS